MADDDNSWGGHDLNIHSDAEFEWTDAAGETHKEKVAAGERYKLQNSCNAAAFLRGYVSAGGTGYKGADLSSMVSTLDEMCAGKSTTDTVLGESPDVHSAPVPPPSVPQETAPETTDQDQGTLSAPPLVSAPEPEVGITVESQSPARDEPPGRTIEEQFHDPRSRITESDLTDRLRERGTLQGDLDDAYERVLRNEPTPGLPHYHFGRNNAPRPRTIADPVDLFQGAFYLTVVDCMLPSRGIPLQLVRMYRSGMPFYGPWGFNWDHNYNVYLRPLDDGNAAVWTGRLSEDVYRVQADGTFEPPLGIPYRLSYDAATIARDESYALEDRGGVTQHFERPPGWPFPDRLPMVRVEDRDGHGHDVDYDADGRVARVRDDAGRTLTFAYGECGLLEQVSDHTGRQWGYIHDMDAAHLVAVVGPATLTIPDGAVTRYEYDDKAEGHPLLRHNLTRLVAPDGRPVVMNEYEHDPASEDFARIITQHYGCARADFRTTKLQDVPRIASAINLPTRRVETMIDGVYRVYTFNFRGDLLDDRFRLIRDKSYRLWAKVYEYDAFGNQTLDRDPDGLSVIREYDVTNADPRARSNVLRVLREAPPTAAIPAQVLMEIEYEPRFHQPRRITDGAAHTTRYVYDYESNPAGTGDLVRIEHPDVTLPDGTVQHAIERLVYTAGGELFQHISATGRVVEHHYFGPGPNEGLLKEVVRDPGGLALSESYDYDAWGNGVTLTDGSGLVTRFEFDASGLLLSLRLPGSLVAHRYEYDKAGHPMRSLMPRGSYTDPVITGDAIVSTFEYDALGQVVKATAAANTVTPRTSSYDYDAWGQIVRIVDPLGREMRVVYDERGLILEERRGSGATARVSTNVYDRNGNRTAAIEPGGRRTEFRPDPWGAYDRVRYAAPGGAWTELRLSFGRSEVLSGMSITGLPAPGQPATTLFETTVDYDERRRPRSSRRLGLDATLWWNADGDLDRQVDVSGHATSYKYDAAGRLWRIEDAGGNAIEYTYDAGDRLTEVLRRELRHDGIVDVTATKYGYDARGNADSTTDPLNNVTKLEFDDRGLSTAIVDSLGRRIEFEYDAAGDMVRRRSAASGIAYGWQRDRAGRIEVFRDALGAETQYDINEFDETFAVRYPDGTSHRFVHSPAGDLQQETTPGGTTLTYTVGSSGEVERIDAVAGANLLATPPITFERDGLGRIVRAVQAGIVVERGYDQLGRLVLDATAGRRFERTFDDAASSFTMKYPDGRRDRVKMDVLRRITSIELEQRGMPALTGTVAPGTALVSYAYDGLNRLAERTLFNGVRSTFTYDRACRLIHIDHALGAAAPFNQLHNVYDALGLRRVCVQTPAPQRSSFYEYDALSRLKNGVQGIAIPATALPITQAEADAYVAAFGAAPAGAETHRFDLDAGDVRLTYSRIDAAGTTTSTYSSNSLRQVTGIDTALPGGAHDIAAIGWHTEGHRVSDGTRRYVYDALGQLVEIRNAVDGSLILSQTFDPFGRLVDWSEAGGAGESVDWFEDRRVGRRSAAGVAEQQSWSAIAEEAPVLSNGANRWTVQDDRFSMLSFGAEDGSLLERYAYDPFGMPRVFAPDGVTPRPLANANRRPIFGGMEWAAASLYSGKPRVYDPVLGQFLQRDPAGYGDGPCLYAYGANDPVDNVDSSGLWIETAWDVASLGLGLYSAKNDFTEGRWGWFALDVVGIVLDTAAVVLPLVPGGVGMAIRGLRAGTLGAAGATWRTGRIVTGTSAAAVRTGRLAYRAETVVRGGQTVDHVISVGQGFYNSYDEFGHGNYLSGMAYLGVAGLGARGAMAKWYDMPRTTRKPLNADELPYYPAGVIFPTYARGARRAFGNRLEMLRNPRVKYTVRQLFSDNRTSETVRAQYWRRNRSRHADGMQLQHTWFMDSGGAPQWVRNAGLNLIEVPQRLNSWMGDGVARNRMFRFHVASMLGVAGSAGYETTREISELLSGDQSRGAASAGKDESASPPK